VAVAFALVGLLLFGRSISYPFHFDDVLILADNNVSTAANWPHFFNPLHMRQLTFFTFYLNHLAAGHNAGSYHLVNVVLHIANAVLFFIVLRRIVEARLALIAAAIFLVHPIQTEPVIYVYQRSVLLAGLFSLLGLICYQRNRLWIAVLMFVLAFESKESSLAVPLLLAVLHLSNRSFVFGVGVDARIKQSRIRALVFLGIVGFLSIAALAVLAHQRETTVGIGAAGRISPLAYLLTETRVVFTYLRLLVFPFPQSLEYDFAPIHGMSIKVVAQIAGLLLMLAAGIYLARSEKWRFTGYSVVAFFVLLAPTSTIIPSTDFAFEHRLYLPMLAFAAFASSIVLRLKRPLLYTIPVVVIFSIATFQRGNVWASEATLWEDAVQRAPNKSRVWFNLGGAYIHSDPERARAAYNRALELTPDFAQAYYDLGLIEQTKRNYDQAVRYYEQTLRLDPNYWPASNNLGNTLMSLGRNDEALKAFQTTLRLNPDHWPSQYNIAIVYFSSSRFAEAIPQLRTVLDWRPDFTDARYMLAVSLFRTGQQTDANREWQKLGTNVGQSPMPAIISSGDALNAGRRIR